MPTDMSVNTLMIHFQALQYKGMKPSKFGYETYVLVDAVTSTIRSVFLVYGACGVKDNQWLFGNKDSLYSNFVSLMLIQLPSTTWNYIWEQNVFLFLSEKNARDFFWLRRDK